MKISNTKREKIYEQILAFLYSISPKPAFTSNIAMELARDEEFVFSLLKSLKSKGFVVEVDKNSKGVKYLRRRRWKLSGVAYASYQKHQPH